MFLELLLHLTPSGPAFSFVRQARGRGGGGGGSEARMPKIKVSINRLKRNFAWVIISMKAFLMQNVRLIAFLVLEIWSHKISLGRTGNKSLNSPIYPRKTGLTFKKMDFYVQNRSSRPKIDPPPMSISAIFKQRKNFSFSKFLDVSMRK